MTPPDDNKDNLLDLADARKRQKILQKEQKKKEKEKKQRQAQFTGGGGRGYNTQTPKGKIISMIQFLLVIAMVAYMMHLCQFG